MSGVGNVAPDVVPGDLVVVGDSRHWSGIFLGVVNATGYCSEAAVKLHDDLYKNNKLTLWRTCRVERDSKEET